MSLSHQWLWRLPTSGMCTVSPTLMSMAAVYFEMSEQFYQITRCHIPHQTLFSWLQFYKHYVSNTEPVITFYYNNLLTHKFWKGNHNLKMQKRKPQFKNAMKFCLLKTGSTPLSGTPNIWISMEYDNCTVNITTNITYVKRIMLAIFYDFLITYNWAFWFKVKLQCTKIKPSKILHAKFFDIMAMK